MSEENNENNQEETQSSEAIAEEYNFKDDISAFSDIVLDCKVILGSAKMTVGQFLKITRGSILELEQKIDSDMDILVNGCKVADGEVNLAENEVIAIEVTQVHKPRRY